MAALGCGRRSADTAARVEAADASVVDASVSAQAEALSPLGGVPWMTTLDLGDGAIAHVAVPLGATGPRPVVVGVHGAGDHADWACSEWLATTGGAAFVVCPHGSRDPRWEGALVWSSPAQIAKRSTRALEALRERFGAYVADGPAIYGAWSQGATLAGAAIAAARADGGDAPFDRVVLVEGGYGGVDANAMARSFRAAGIERTVVCCASVVCRKLSTELTAAGLRVGLEVHGVDVGLRGHVFDAPVFSAIRRELPWLVAGDPRWTGLLR